MCRAYEININNCVLTFSSLLFYMFDLPKEVNCQLPKAVSICVECLLHHEKIIWDSQQLCDSPQKCWFWLMLQMFSSFVELVLGETSSRCE